MQVLDKLGAVGAFVAAGSCPACFPLLAVVGSTLGLGFLKPYEGVVMYVFQGLVLLSLIGNVIAFRGHRKLLPLIAGIASPAFIFFAFYFYFHPAILYTGLFGLMVAAVMNFLANRKCKSCQT